MSVLLYGTPGPPHRDAEVTDDVRKDGYSPLNREFAINPHGQMATSVPVVELIANGLQSLFLRSSTDTAVPDSWSVFKLFTYRRWF